MFRLLGPDTRGAAGPEYKPFRSDMDSPVMAGSCLTPGVIVRIFVPGGALTGCSCGVRVAVCTPEVIRGPTPGGRREPRALAARLGAAGAAGSAAACAFASAGVSSTSNSITSTGAPKPLARDMPAAEDSISGRDQHLTTGLQYVYVHYIAM